MEAFARDLARVAAGDVRPDFIVAPDVVAGGRSSLALSLSWLEAVTRVGPAYLAVQDGMSEPEVAEALPGFSGIFVGGTVPWKMRTGGSWVRFGHRLGLPVHIGKVGSMRRVIWAQGIGADSIDSSMLLWSKENKRAFHRGVKSRQTDHGW